MNKSERIKELVFLINKYNSEYYNMDKPTISDDEWDALYNELKSLEAQTGTILPDSPTQVVGGGILTSFKKHTHINQLYSLDKSQSIEEVKKWFDGIVQKYPQTTFAAGYKFDGLFIVLTYENGKLITAATRGNGRVGENVTAQIKTIKSIPHKINILEKVEIGGEGMMRRSVLAEYNARMEATGGELLKNPRNGAAGAIRNLDPKITRERNLDFFAHSLTKIDSIGLSYQDSLEQLTENGFSLPMPKDWKDIKTFDQVQAIIDTINAQRDNLDFDTDGIVFTVNQPKVREELGHTIKFPRFVMSYKFAAEVETTLLLDVVWQVGRTGKVTPIAVLEPVQLAGATITRATLNNYGDLTRKKLNIGGTVLVRRSNEVIPEVLGMAPECKMHDEECKIQDIEMCPSCGSKLEIVGANKFCKNNACPARNLEKFCHFVRRDCMNIEGLSEKTIEAMLDKSLVTRLGDLYRLTQSQLATLDGHKDKKITNLLNSITSSRKISLSNFINALGIPNIGKKASSSLANAFKSLPALRSATADDFVNLDEFGDIMAQSLIAFFADADNVAEVDDLVQFLDISHDTKVGCFSGLTICITGTLENYTRTQLTKILEGQGAIVSSTVTKGTSVLIAGENCGSKLATAKKLGIRIVEQGELEDFIA
jgi:DNA ligase (NAD+)